LRAAPAPRLGDGHIARQAAGAGSPPMARVDHRMMHRSLGKERQTGKDSFVTVQTTKKDVRRREDPGGLLEKREAPAFEKETSVRG